MNCPESCNPALLSVIFAFRPFLYVLLRKADLISDLGQITFVVGVHIRTISETRPPERNLQKEVKSTRVQSYTNT